MKTTKVTYEKPCSKVWNMELQGIIMEGTVLEPIEPGDEHEW